MKTDGQILRDAGISQSLDNADSKIDNWSNIAYSFLIYYSKINKEYMAEDVRTASANIVPEPPSKRAWGGIFAKAKKNNLIERIGYGNVKNPNAHCTPATIWRTADAS